MSDRTGTPYSAVLGALAATAGVAGNDAAGLARRADAIVDWLEGEGWELAQRDVGSGRALRVVPEPAPARDLMAELEASIAAAREARRAREAGS